MSPSDLASRLRHRLVLESATRDADGRDTWSAISTVWAAIEPIGGAELEAGGHRAGSATHRLTIRFRADVSAANRLTKGARVFVIRAAFDPDERGVALTILAEEEPR